MKRCIDCDYFGGCEKAGEVCEKYKKTFHRTITKLDKVDNTLDEIGFDYCDEKGLEWEDDE